MEFKERRPPASQQQLPVDIETEWNLKNVRKIHVPPVNTVDIETEWNLKEDLQVSIDELQKVDIETEWNLKGLYAYEAHAQKR